jgi:hypothetical protein
LISFSKTWSKSEPEPSWVLDEFAADGEVEDGLAELLDVFGAGGEAREVVEIEAGVLAKLFAACAVIQAVQ